MFKTSKPETGGFKRKLYHCTKFKLVFQFNSNLFDTIASALTIEYFFIVTWLKRHISTYNIKCDIRETFTTFYEIKYLVLHQIVTFLLSWLKKKKTHSHCMWKKPSFSLFFESIKPVWLLTPSSSRNLEVFFSNFEMAN